MAPFLTARRIVKRFPSVVANDHVDFDVGRGEIHALLGENGAGKSTLMQIIYGQYAMDSGEIEVEGRPVAIRNTRDAIDLGIGMIHQEFMLVRRFSVVENVVMGLDGTKGGAKGPLVDLKAAAARLAELSRQHGLQVDPFELVEHLPVGVQQRVEILKLLYRDARLLILDEPTAVLTPQETEALFCVLRELAAQGRSIVIVTHKLKEIMAISDRVTIMRDGRVVASVKTAESSQDELARLMVGREVSLRASKSARPAGSDVLRIEGLHVADGRGHGAVNGVDLTVREGEILGLAGVDGNGQSELAEAIMNLRPVARGRVLLGDADLTRASPAEHHRQGLAYVPADRRHVGALTDLSIARNAILGRQRAFAGRAGLMEEDRISGFASELIERFDIRPRNPAYTAGKLSGGNLQKVILGREVMRDPAAIVIEQPTRGLDVGAIESVWREIIAQRDAGKAILLISAELEEILNLADRIAVIYEGRIMGVIDAAEASLASIGMMMAGAAPRRSRLEVVS
ncbi:ABC transporter ATP-binding protein [Mesorhizobium sp. SP-1A]|uniref:ABC transporter ATP-binding protein n=1 Tax=Mesorhizobium sp. SP-1A TaxID=3077840 RepID=UPI0028F73121|nr:ABC transporter ATP-binding protein [Mesorhizobium sp. SP-1A]